ncbi:MAG: HPr kinase/phosphatase C-terminal domain-containing protein [Pseudomonadota bacterium]
MADDSGQPGPTQPSDPMHDDSDTGMIGSALRPQIIHATAVGINGRGVLIRGASGSGKSDLALRLILRSGVGPGAPLIQLICDDYVELSGPEPAAGNDDPGTMQSPDSLGVRAGSDHIKGLLEVRGVGIFEVPTLMTATVHLVVDLVCAEAVIARLPDGDEAVAEIAGQRLPRLMLNPFEGSAPDKIIMAMTHRQISND